MLEKLNPSLIRRNDAADLYDWDDLVQEDRVHRLIYTDPAIFAAEMSNIFGAVWVYLGHDSQIPRNDDFITTRLGMRPIILLRDSQGKIRALFNRCTHRGTTLARKDKEADGKSDRYLSDLKHRLTRFSDHFNGQVVATITSLLSNAVRGV